MMMGVRNASTHLTSRADDMESVEDMDGSSRPQDAHFPQRMRRGSARTTLPEMDLYLVAAVMLLNGSGITSQAQFVGYLGGNVLEGHGGARYPLEAHPVEREARQLTNLHLPLDEVVASPVAVHTEE